jgi:uncharacterized protein (DUF1015 family)
LRGVVKKHELTRPDKEDDRVRHIETLNAQTGPAFLIYRAAPAVDQFIARKSAEPPEVDFTAADGVRHAAWAIHDAADIRFVEEEFARLPCLYIADGHHRSAAAARVFKKRGGAGHSAHFLAVIFPDNQVQVLPYNRVVRDLNRLTPEAFLQKLLAVGDIVPSTGSAPGSKHEFCFYLAGEWQTLRFKPSLTQVSEPIERLDVTLLQNHVLAPILGISDPRTSQRINFVGGIRGTVELETLVNSGEHVCAFSLFPTGVEDLLAVADADGLMPPKSTWFEPKLRDGMFSHLI